MMTLLFSYYIFFREQKIVHSKIIEKMEKGYNYIKKEEPLDNLQKLN